MKAKKDGDANPKAPLPESGGGDDWIGISKEDTLRAERQIAARMASSMAFWAASLEAYQTMVQEWTQSRQAALRKSMKTLSNLQSGQSEETAEQAADAMVEQWASFQRDFLAVQMKTAAKAGALFGKAVEAGRAVELKDPLHETLRRAEADMFKPRETSNK
jgi:alkanesulfonate monooxygenase SsuD/methylene tetrahydromethanopterin reductase-like flavin-dependent oxidoreductase (luciferase family)